MKTPPIRKNKTILHLALLISLVSMLMATLAMSFVFFREYQFKQNLLCADISSSIRSIRSDAISDNYHDYMRSKAIKAVSVMFAEIRTGMEATSLSAGVMGMEINDLHFMCEAYPDYKIGQITAFNLSGNLEERSRFNREFANMLGWQKVPQDYQLTTIGYWLLSELKKQPLNHFLNIGSST